MSDIPHALQSLYREALKMKGSHTPMSKESLGVILSSLANKYPFIGLTADDQETAEQLISELKELFDKYPPVDK